MIPKLERSQNLRRLLKSSFQPQKRHLWSKVLCSLHFLPTSLEIFPTTLLARHQFRRLQNLRSISNPRQIASKLASCRRSLMVHHLHQQLPISLPLILINHLSALSMLAMPEIDPRYISCKLWPTTSLLLTVATILPRRAKTAGKLIGPTVSGSTWH